jgi:hypothetical protein
MLVNSDTLPCLCNRVQSNETCCPPPLMLLELATFNSFQAFSIPNFKLNTTKPRSSDKDQRMFVQRGIEGKLRWNSDELQVFYIVSNHLLLQSPVSLPEENQLQLQLTKKRPTKGHWVYFHMTYHRCNTCGKSKEGKDRLVEYNYDFETRKTRK